MSDQPEEMLTIQTEKIDVDEHAEMLEERRLFQEKVAHFLPRCVNPECGNTIPHTRAMQRNYTCSAECFKLLKAYRRYHLMARKCPTCFHPSTPKEREEFKAFRRSRGELREGRGRPKQKKVDTKAEE